MKLERSHISKLSGLKYATQEFVITIGPADGPVPNLVRLEIADVIDITLTRFEVGVLAQELRMHNE